MDPMNRIEQALSCAIEQSLAVAVAPDAANKKAPRKSRPWCATCPNSKSAIRWCISITVSAAIMA